MLIVDSQVHVWDPNTPERPWQEGAVKPHREAPFGADELRREMDAAGVHRAVLVPPSWDANRNDLVDRVAERHPGLKLALCHLALSSSKKDKEWIMGRGLCEWLEWKLPGT